MISARAVCRFIGRYWQHFGAMIVGFVLASYIFFLQTSPFDWNTPTVKTNEVKAGVPFRVDFTVRSDENCSVDITRLAERTGANGGVIQLPPLGTEHKLIRDVKGVRASHFMVTFPAGTEAARYRIFSRIRSDCPWRIVRHQMDTDAVVVNVVP